LIVRHETKQRARSKMNSDSRQCASYTIKNYVNRVPVNFRGPSREADGNLCQEFKQFKQCLYNAVSYTARDTISSRRESKKGSSLSHGYSSVLTTVKYQFN